MNARNVLEEIDQENDVVQLLVREAVGVAMDSPLREPILEAVSDAEGVERRSSEPDAPATSEEATAEPTAEGAQGKGRGTKALQGVVVFAVMFTVLYLTFRRLTGDGS